MSRIFISHSSKNDDWAIALRDWLLAEGWTGSDDIFLDVDPQRGIAAGQKWQEAFADAATRCEAVLFLVSSQWLTSRWCHDEFQLANRYNKKLFALIVDDSSLDDLPGGITSRWQVVNLVGEPARRFIAVHPHSQERWPVHIAEAGLAQLKTGLNKAGIGPENFELQKDEDGPFGWRSPYPGLRALDVEDAAVFFGRDADLIRGMDTLRGIVAHKAPQLAVVLGASGSGKSSFLRAGLWPRLLRDDSQWLPLKVIRAGRTGAIEGEEGLLASLQDVHDRFALKVSRSQLRDNLKDGDSFVALLRELRREGAKRALIEGDDLPVPVLCLDQCEEIFSSNADPECEQLQMLASAACESCEALLVATIRSDSYSLMQNAKSLNGVEHVAISLRQVPQGEFANIIREPAELLRRKVGPDAPVFDAAAVEHLQREIEGEPDALPLLAFVLQRLLLEHIGESTIGVEQINRTGGLRKAIETEANAAFGDASISKDGSDRHSALRKLFVPLLVRIDHEEKDARRHVALQSEIAEDVLPLAQALTERRLLVVRAAKRQVGNVAIDEASPSNALAAPADLQNNTIEVSHEALLRHWDMLAQILGEDREALLLLESVLVASAAWASEPDQNKKDYLIHKGTRLANARSLSGRDKRWAKELVLAQDYLDACATAEAAVRKSKRRWRSLVAALSVVIVGGGLVAMNFEQVRQATYWLLHVRPHIKAESEEQQLLRAGLSFIECRDCPEMIFIEKGTYRRGGPRRGSPDWEREFPFLDVEIRQHFAVSVTEISFSHWEVCAAQGACRLNISAGHWGRGEQPVISISWHDAQSYVRWISKLTGKTYRLLSEAEWEFAARGGTTTSYSFRPEHIDKHAWHEGTANGGPKVVGQLAANPNGLKDMHGNVAEWVEDCFDWNYKRVPRTEEAWVPDPECTKRVIRGGSWQTDVSALRSGSRNRRDPHDEDLKDVGFRIARDMSAGE